MYSVFLNNMEFPVAPDKIDLKINNQNKTVTLVNEGEVNLLKKAGLSEVTTKLRVPHYPLPFTRNLMPVQYYLSKLENLKTSKMPVQFIVFRDELYNTNLKVSLEDYRVDESANNGPLTIIDIKLKQYGEYGDIKAKIEEKTVNGEKVLTIQKQKDRIDTRTPQQTVKAVEGDTLWSIAKKHLGDGSMYRNLAELNNLSNPNGILKGQVIRLE